MSLSRGKTLVTEGYGLQQCDLPPFEEGRIDPREWFAAPGRPLEIEIGSGKGTFLVQEAPLRPAVNYLGIEKSMDFYRYAADRVRRRELDNVRLLRADAAEFLRFWCGDGVAAVVHLYFADPWPKKRHHKRRIIQDRVLGDLHRILGPAGELRLVTDHEELWAWYEQCARRHASDGLSRAGPAAALPVAHTVLGLGREVGVRGTVEVAHVLVRSRPGVLVSDQHCDRRAQGHPFES